MQEKLLLPSFLQISQFKSDIYKFSKKSIILLMDMVKQEFGSTLSPKFLTKHRKQLQTTHFCFSVQNRDKSWTIIKRLVDFIKLQEQIKGKYKQKVPSIPVRKQSELNQHNKEQMIQFLQIFLKTISGNNSICREKSFQKFIENLAPTQRKKMKIFKQMQLSKRAGGRHNQSSLKRALCYMLNWRTKFFTITNQGVYFTDNDMDFRIQEMIPFSNGFQVQYGEGQTGYTYGIIINSSQRILSIDAGDIFNFTYFIYWLRKAMKDNDYLSRKRFQSFASIRQKCDAKAYVDGKQYFSDVCDALLAAKSEIFITGWMVSPHFHLKRPDPNSQFRVDKLLGKIAKSGIKIHIIIYMEPKVALTIDSQYTQQCLQNQSSNIRVLRHPPYVLIPFLWSHHQKMVIVDQKIAFLGGLDIGYGRFDDQNHKLEDINQQYWYGVDYCNYRKKDITKPRQYKVSSIDRTQIPRMPWHDIAVRITGQSVIDITRHFVQYWNYVNFQLNMDERELLMYAGLNQEDINTFAHHGNMRQKQKNYKQSRMQSRISKSPKLKRQSVSESYQVFQQNPYNERKSLQFQPYFDGINQEQLQFYATHMKGESSTDKIDNFFKKIRQKANFQSNRGAINFTELIVTQKKQDIKINEGKQYHQMLRSASMWGLGLNQGKEERSILRAYVQLIYNSKDFIYIQNQFFISVENTVSKAIIQRISRAYENKQKFKMVVVLPSLPGFEGQISEQNAAVMRIQVHYIYATICRGSKSIIQNLSFIPNLEQYIQFFTLRTHGMINFVPVTELIYVHSKLMIIDDSKVIIGSANINDRSLLGSRDSEIAILIQDTESIIIEPRKQKRIHVDQQKESIQSMRKVKKFAHNLRKKLYQEHFDISQKESQDYHNQDVWNEIIQRADKNQQIYRQVFGIYPDNRMKRFKDIKKYAEKADITQYQVMKDLIKGNAIPFQNQFLIYENLQLKASQKQYYVPNINFT